MIRYIIKKILYGIMVLWGVVTILFFLFSADPVDVARIKAGKNPTPELIKDIEHELHLDLPLYQQYMLYLNDLLPISVHNENIEESRIYLDEEEYSATKLFSYAEHRTVVLKVPYFRRDYIRNEPVTDIIAKHMPETIILAAAAMTIAVVFGILLGILSAIYRGSFIDRSSIVISTLGMSAPSFVMAIVVQWIFAILWFEETSIPILPLLGIALGIVIGLVLNKKVAKERFMNFSWAFIGEMMFKGFILSSVVWLVGYALSGFGINLPLIDSYFTSMGTDLSHEGTLHASDAFGDPYLNYHALILPAFTLGIRPLAIITQLTRSSMLDVMSQDYVRTAKAKGLNPFWVLIKHTLKNAMNPVITAVSGHFASLLAGAIFVEAVFNWKGIGNIIFDAISEDKNMPVVIGATIVISAGFVVINVLVDIIYGIIDPRVRIT